MMEVCSWQMDVSQQSFVTIGYLLQDLFPSGESSSYILPSSGTSYLHGLYNSIDLDWALPPGLLHGSSIRSILPPTFSLSYFGHIQTISVLCRFTSKHVPRAVPLMYPFLILSILVPHKDNLHDILTSSTCSSASCLLFRVSVFQPDNSFSLTSICYTFFYGPSDLCFCSQSTTSQQTELTGRHAAAQTTEEGGWNLKLRASPRDFQLLCPIRLSLGVFCELSHLSFPVELRRPIRGGDGSAGSSGYAVAFRRWGEVESCSAAPVNIQSHCSLISAAPAHSTVFVLFR